MYNWIETTFNVSGGVTQAIAVILALAVVLTLFALFIFILKRLMGGQATQNRSRQPRIAVMDSATVDARRRLVLVRRDNIEHLILIGGPTDVVVEQNILRNAPLTQQRSGQPAGPSGIAPLRAPMAPGPDIPVRPDDLALPSEPAPSPVQQARPPAPVPPEAPQAPTTPQVPVPQPGDPEPTTSVARTSMPPVSKAPSFSRPLADPVRPARAAPELAASAATEASTSEPGAGRHTSRAAELLKGAARNGFSRTLGKSPSAAPALTPDLDQEQDKPSDTDKTASVQPVNPPAEPAAPPSEVKGSASPLKSLTRPFSPRERPSYGGHSISPPASGPAARAKTALMKPLEAAQQREKVEPVMGGDAPASFAEAKEAPDVAAPNSALPDPKAQSDKPEAPAVAAVTSHAETVPTEEARPAPGMADSQASAPIDQTTADKTSAAPAPETSAPPVGTPEPETGADGQTETSPKEPEAEAEPAAEKKAAANQEPAPDISLDMSDLLEDVPQKEAPATGTDSDTAAGETPAASQAPEPTITAAPAAGGPSATEKSKTVEPVKPAPRPTGGLGDRNPIEDEMAKILDELGGQPN